MLRDSLDRKKFELLDLNGVEEAIKKNPDQIDEIFKAITKDFDRFAGNLNDLSKLVKIIPGKQEEIYKQFNERFSHYYHYGLFSALGQLKSIFPDHYSEISSNAKLVPHVQSLKMLQSN